MPIHALCLLAVCLCLRALVIIGLSTAFNALISLPALALYVSYLFPILFLLWRRLSTGHPAPIPWGPIKLGRVGPFVNAYAICYIVFVLIWMPFPTTLPVDRFNMNYAGPIFGAVMLIAVLDWCWNGRKRFQSPFPGSGM
jgi:choline transport protein